MPRSEEARTPSEFEGESSPDPAVLVTPLEVLKQARELVRRLSSNDAAEREAAERHLGSMGHRARQALADGATAADPRVREICTRLLPGAADHEMRARIRALLADTDGKYNHNLPGVRAYLKQTGTSPNAIALAAAVFRYTENRELFTAIEKGSADGGRVLFSRRLRLYEQWQPKVFVNGKGSGGVEPVLEHLAAIFVAESAVPSEHIPSPGIGPGQWVNGWQFGSATHHGHALAGFGPHPDAYKAVVARWIATRTTPRELHYLTMYYSQFGIEQFPEMLPALSRVVTTPGVDVRCKCDAMKVLVQYFQREEVVPILVRAFRDDELVEQVRFPLPGGGEDRHPCRVRDVARAFLLHLANESIEGYGYEYNPIYGVNRFADIHFIRDGVYAIRTEEGRALADVRFGWWLLKQDLRGAP